MSFKSVLNFNSKTFNVLNFDISFDRPVDHFRRPSGLIRGCKIAFTIEATDNNDFFTWFMSQFTTKEGTFVFYQRDSEQKMRDIEFKKAYIISYNENFSAHGDNPYVINMEISCDEVRILQAFMAAFWPEE
jgi:hypothetical protein